MHGVAELRTDPRRGATVAHKKYGQTIRMYDDLHHKINTLAAHNRVSAQDLYHALCSDRADQLMRRMMEELGGKKPGGKPLAVVVFEEFGIEWQKPARGASAARPAEAANGDGEHGRKVRTRRQKDG
jgi:hypothetical protein